MGAVEVAESDGMCGTERLELRGADKRALGPFLPPIIRVSRERLPEQAEDAGNLVAVAAGELAIPDAIEVIPDLPVIASLGHELFRQPRALLLDRLFRRFGELLALRELFEVQADDPLAPDSRGTSRAQLFRAERHIRLDQPRLDDLQLLPEIGLHFLEKSGGRESFLQRLVAGLDLIGGQIGDDAQHLRRTSLAGFGVE